MHAPRVRSKRSYTPEQRAAARERTRLWREAHPDYNASYNRANRLRLVASNANYRAKQLGLTGLVTYDELAAIFTAWDWRCWMCGGAADCTDHVIPLSKGGDHHAGNIRPACTHCNSVKGASLPLREEVAS